MASFTCAGFVLGEESSGLEHSLGTRIVNDADDLVICAEKHRRGGVATTREIMGS